MTQRPQGPRQPAFILLLIFSLTGSAACDLLKKTFYIDWEEEKREYLEPLGFIEEDAGEEDGEEADDGGEVAPAPDLPSTEAPAGAEEGRDAGEDAGAAGADLPDAAADAAPADVPPEGAADAVEAEEGAAAPYIVPMTLPPGPPEAAKAPPTKIKIKPKVVLRTVLGLLALFILAYLASHPRIVKLEEKLCVSHLVTAGFPFVALGVIARFPQVGILNDSILEKLMPFLQIGLGWLGFSTGFRFDLRDFDNMPKGTGLITTLVTLLSFAAIVVACGLPLLVFGQPFTDATFLRDAIILGAAGVLTAPTVARMCSPEGPAGPVLKRISSLDDLAAVFALTFLGAFFRPGGQEVLWRIPSTAWLFMTLGVGGTVGIVVYVVMRRPAKPSEAIALLIGSVAFASGMAGYLFLSPIVICFLAGILLANLPGGTKDTMRSTLDLLERPIYLVFLVVAGALWDVSDWRGWVLLPFFLVARLAGRFVGTLLVRGHPSRELIRGAGTMLITSPIGPLSIAIVVSYQILYGGRAVPWIVTAVIGGALWTEIIVQVATRLREKFAGRETMV
jgi:hypothetical protein